MIHLHVHSHFSFLDGASSPDVLLRQASALGMTALALTDHNGLYGLVRFLHAARACDIKPIAGTEIVLRLDETHPLSGQKPHLVLLAQNRTGYANLCRIITRTQLDYQDDPQITLDDLAAHTEGVICLSACRRGEVSSLVASGHREEARRSVQRYADLFPDRFYLELEHHLLPDDTALVHALYDLARQEGLPFLLANDVHYATPDAYRLRDVMACIATRTTLEEWSDVRHTNAEYYLKSEEEMRQVFHSLPAHSIQEGIEATHAVAASCNLELLAVFSRPPDFPVPPQETAFSYLYNLCQEGVRRLYRPLTPAVISQLAHELSVIEHMGLASFFLCVWDIVRFARERGIRCAGRGSAADSIVAYVLGITAVDPLANNLLFERFLNPGRLEMPDVDIDFDSTRRDEVIEYIQGRYGAEHAAMVANVVTYRSRSAFRDVAKVMGLSPAAVDHLAAKLSYRGVRAMREEMELVGALLPSERRDETLEGTVLDTIIDLCEQLDGFPRHLSLHNGGMLITAEPLVDVVPIEYATSGVRVCQFNKDDVEMLGLIKFDILGLRTLSIVDEAVRMVKEQRAINLPIDDLPTDDSAVYDLICSSRTIGVFQIESPGQWSLLERAQPRTFGDLIVQIALFRPGPLQGGMVHPFIERRQGREAVSYPHPSLESCLRDTLGIVLFQEQVLQVAHDFAGLSYAQADGLRRAISHYRTEVQMDACREEFVESAVRHGRDRDLAESIYEMIAYFSGYGFCRSHAAAFAKIVYQTAFLKTYYPAELLAAILSNEPCCYYPAQTVLEEARRWGIRVHTVDINRSRARYMAECDAIRMGLMQVKGVAEDTAEAIVCARGGSSFRSLADFWERTEVDRDVVENLIGVGAFDCLGMGRRALLWSLEEVVRSVPRGQEPHAATLIRQRGAAPALPPLSPLEIAGLDFTLQGASARHSIMSFYRRPLARSGVLSSGQMQSRPPGSLVITAGVVISRQQPPTANGMTFLVLSDEEGETPVAVYPDVYREYRQTINGNAALIIEGTIQRERYLTSLLATRLWSLQAHTHVEDTPTPPRLGPDRLPPPPPAFLVEVDDLQRGPH